MMLKSKIDRQMVLYFSVGMIFLLIGLVLSSHLLQGRRAKAQTPTGAPPPSETKNSIVSDLIPESDGPELESGTEYRYEPVGKRDPFRPFRDSKIGIGQIRASNRSPEPLEKFELKNLQVVAIIWGNEKPRALIQDGEKQIHAVVKGQRIGRNEGFIAEIREGEIVVVELFDLNGKVVKESVVMPIRK